MGRNLGGGSSTSLQQKHNKIRNKKFVSFCLGFAIFFGINPITIQANAADEAASTEKSNVGRNDSSGTYAKQIHWINFAKFTNLDKTGSLTEKSVLETEPRKGYKLTVKVKKLAPFITSKSYVDMLTKRNADKGTNYTVPEGAENAVNITGKEPDNAGVGPSEFDKDPKLSYVPEIKNGKFTGKYIKDGKVPYGHNVLQGSDYATDNLTAKYVIGKTPDSDIINAGVTLELSATYNGKPAPVNLIAADGEEVRFREFIAMVTDGTPWSLLDISGATEPTEVDGKLTDISGEIVHDRTTDEEKDQLYKAKPQEKDLPYLYATDAQNKQLFKYEDVGYWDILNNTTFGDPKIVAEYAEKIAKTEKEIAANKNNAEKLDKLNAALAEYKKLRSAAVVGAGTQTVGNYSEVHQYGNPIWISNNVKEFSFYWNSPAKQNMRFGFLFYDTGDAPKSYGSALHTLPIAKDAAKPYFGTKEPDLDVSDDPKANPYSADDQINDPDEGEAQLVGDGKKYAVHDGSAKTYSLDIIANNDNKKSTEPAYAYGWVDFNNDGIFSDDEKSELGLVTGQNQKLTLNWSGDNVKVTDTSISKLATRIRISADKESIQEAAGIAPTGEVEDFQINVVHPPKGSKETTVGYKGETQTATIKFTASGKVAGTEDNNAINTKEPAYIVDKDGKKVTLDKDGYYVVPGEGKYKITDQGADVAVEFVPEADFVGKAEGITIRRTDLNGKTTGWTDEENENISDQTNTMDGRYIPIVKTKGEVIIHYVNEQGETIKDDHTDTPLVDVIDDQGASVTVKYDTTDNKPTTIVKDGRTYELVPAKTIGVENGKVTAGRTEVTYVYREAKGKVIVHYKDEAGNTIKETVVDTPETTPGTPYDTTDNKPTRIVKDGRTYELVPAKTIGVENGKVTAGTTEVTYIYREVTKPANPILARTGSMIYPVAIISGLALAFGAFLTLFRRKQS